MRPRQVFERGLALVRDLDVDGFADLFAADGVMECPFAQAGAPRRLEGRDAIRAYLGAGAEHARRSGRRSGRRIAGVGSVVVHETTDPEVIVAEFDQLEENALTGRGRRVSFIHVIRVHDGRIASYRDYIDYAAIAEMTGA